METPLARDPMESPSSKDINANPAETSTDHSSDQQIDQDTALSPFPAKPDGNDRTVSTPHPTPVCMQGEHTPHIRRSSQVVMRRSNCSVPILPWAPPGTILFWGLPWSPYHFIFPLPRPI